MDAPALCLGHGAQKGQGRALAIGAGDVDDRRQLVLRPAHRLADPEHALEIEVDALGVQGAQPFQRRVEGEKPVGHGAG